MEIIDEMKRKGQLYSTFWTPRNIEQWAEEIISEWREVKEEEGVTAGYNFLAEEFHKLGAAAFLKPKSDMRLTSEELARLLPPSITGYTKSK